MQGGGHVPGVDYDQYDGSGEAGFQDYEQIRAQCLADGVLFEDPEFPAEESSVFFSSEGRRSFEWLRPHVNLNCGNMSIIMLTILSEKINAYLCMYIA